MKRSVSTFISDTARRHALIARIENWTEVPLLCLAFIMIPLLVGPFFWELSAIEVVIFGIIDILIWMIFAAVLITKVIIAPKKLAFLRANWLEVLIVAVPFARPLQIIRLFLFGSRLLRGLRQLTEPDFLVVYGLGLIIIASTIWSIVEIGPSPFIHSYADALWLAVVTITTVGYGDTYPVTVIGRSVALVLMVAGIGVFGLLAARLASLFVHHVDNSNITELLDEVQNLRKEISELRDQLGHPSAK